MQEGRHLLVVTEGHEVCFSPRTEWASDKDMTDLHATREKDNQINV